MTVKVEIIFSAFMPILNLMPATHFQIVRTREAKDWQSCVVLKNTWWNILQHLSIITQ